MTARAFPRLAAGALALGALAATPAAAEIYRCPGPGGRPVYTSDAAACPGAQRHEPSRDVQRVPSASPAEPGAAASGPGTAGARPSAPAAAADEPEDAQAAMWRRKRTAAEAELAELRHGIDELRELVTWCNRGGDLVVEDEVGVRDPYDCGDARSAFESASARIDALRAYLGGGLEEECRRAGCLPGWIR